MRASMLPARIDSCGGASAGDVDEFGFTLGLDGGGTSSSSSSIMIGEVRDPIPLTVMVGEYERRRLEPESKPLQRGLSLCNRNGWHARMSWSSCSTYSVVNLLCLCVPVSSNETNARYNTVRQHIRNLSALCSLVLCLLDKLLLDRFRACNLQFNP